MKTFQDGDPLFGVMMNAIANLWPNGTAVLSGCTQTGSGATRQITVAAGTVVINGTVRSVSQQTKTLDAAAFDRYDLLSVNSSGTVVVTKGTEERRVPALPANSVPIAICLVETGQTTLPADRIFDARLLSSHMPTGAMLVDEIRELTPGGDIQIVNNARYRTVLAVPSNTTRASSDAEVSQSGSIGTFTKVKEITLGSTHFTPNAAYPTLTSSYRVYFEIRQSRADDYDWSYKAQAQVYVNGVAQDTPRTTDGTTNWCPFTVDVSGLKAGDKIQLYLRNSGTGELGDRQARYFRLQADYNAAPMLGLTPDDFVVNL